jgi:hypothetical protein
LAQQNVALFHAGIEAVNRGDAEAMVAISAPMRTDRAEPEGNVETMT